MKKEFGIHPQKEEELLPTGPVQLSMFSFNRSLEFWSID
jgi:hypothetical protein